MAARGPGEGGTGRRGGRGHTGGQEDRRTGGQEAGSAFVKETVGLEDLTGRQYVNCLAVSDTPGDSMILATAAPAWSSTLDLHHLASPLPAPYGTPSPWSSPSSTSCSRSPSSLEEVTRIHRKSSKR